MESLTSILTKDRKGFGTFREEEEPWQCQVSKGELVTEIPKNERRPIEGGKPAPNYRLYRHEDNATVVLYAGRFDVSPVEDKELDYLLAVEPPNVRLQEYLKSDETKKTKMELVCDDVVLFKMKLSNGPDTFVKGIIRYLGPLEEKEGIFFGIEIQEQMYHGKGNSNGRPYFSCGNNNAVFVALDKIERKSQWYTDKPTQHQPDTHEQKQSDKVVTVQSRFTTRSQASKGAAAAKSNAAKGGIVSNLKQLFGGTYTPDESEMQTVAVDSKFKIGDRVVLQSVRGEVITGTVQYIGSVKVSKEVSESPIPVVGVETDKSVDPAEDFPELFINVPPSHAIKVFKVPPNHSRVFLPEQLVVSVDEYALQQQKDNAAQSQEDTKLRSNDATQWEAEEAKKYGLSLEEFRSQKEYYEAAKQQNQHDDHDQSGFEVIKGGEDSDNHQLHAIHEGQRFPESSSPKAHHHYSLPSSHNAEPPQPPPANLPPPNDLPPSLDPHHQFTIGSMVRLDVQKGEPLYGVLQWVGTIPGINGAIAGVELERPLRDGTDGTWRGIRFFTCPPGRAYFCPITVLRQDTRYLDQGQVPAHLREDIKNPLTRDTPIIEEFDTYYTPELFYKYIGDGHGIQGHHNSCYLDSTVFGLFALSDSFDELLLEEPTEEVGKNVKYYLWKGIVNPLRKYGLARYESVMKLRDSLEEFGRMKGANKDEKDPEEFLNLLFKEILHITPFLSIKRPFGVEQEYFIQLFFEIDPNNTEVPKTDKLLTQMFHEQLTSFTRAPSKLLLQMPHFGKEFRMYNRIIPSLTLDVIPLLDPSARGNQKCFICLKDSVSHACYNCPKEMFNNTDPYVYYCSDCNDKAHSERKGHRVVDAKIKPGTSDVVHFSKMQLLSVICIETSHYVCYTRSGDKWLFHDSMANRLYDMYNIPRVVDVTVELQEWIYSCDNLDRLMNTPAKNIPEYVHRFTQDIYMCVYVNPDLDMYGDDHDPHVQLSEAFNFTTYSVEQHDDAKKISGHKNEEYCRLQNSYDDLLANFKKKEEENHELQNSLEKLAVSYQSKKDECLRLQKDQDTIMTSNQERILQLQTALQRMEEERLTQQNELANLQRRMEDSWKVCHADLVLSKSELGRGGWGVIWIGEFRGQRVAVKQMHELIRSDENFKILHREINTMSQLRHPNLLQFIGAVLDHPSGNPMIITEVMDTSLRKAYESKELTPDPSCRPVILSIMRDVAVGLNYLHCLPDPIIHRDVSSANVLLESKGPRKWKTKISDFGSANIARVAVTATQGAPVYSAPESFVTIHTRKKKQTPKMDSYSYGILLCEVIMCKFPDFDVFDDLLQQVKSISRNSLHILISSCINEEPEKRPTMSQIIEQLDRC